MKKLPYYLLILFVAFIIIQDAASAGTTANRFFGWLFDGIGVAGEFVASVFDGDSGDGDIDLDPEPTPTVTETVTIEPSDEEPASSGTDGG